MTADVRLETEQPVSNATGLSSWAAAFSITVPGRICSPKTTCRADCRQCERSRYERIFRTEKIDKEEVLGAIWKI